MQNPRFEMGNVAEPSCIYTIDSKGCCIFALEGSLAVCLGIQRLTCSAWNRHAVDSVVTQKVPQGETTFDRIIDTVEAQSGGILIRVLMKDGAPLFESYKAANTILQNREKIATVVENIKIKLGQLPSAGSSALKDASVEMQKLIQQQLRPEDVESHESIDKHLKEIFNTFSGMVTGELKTVISSVDALLKTEKILEVEHPFSVDGLASLGKDLLDDKQFPTSKYWNNIAQAREKVVNLLTLVSWPNNRKENPIASIANSSKPTLQRYND